MSQPISVPHNKLGTSDLTVSKFALGSWHVYDRMHFEETVALLRTAIDRGINLFDVGVYTAPTMPPGYTDILFSAAVRAAGIKREEYLLSSKLWLEAFDADQGGFRPQLEGALFRVGAEHADLVVLGDLRRDDLELRDLVHSLAELKADGLINAWGVNNWSASNVQALIDIAREDGVDGPCMAQLKYSVSRRSIPDGAPFAKLWEQGFAMQASDVMEGGYLAGKVSTEREVGRDPGGIRQRIIDDVPGFVQLAESLGATPAQLAIAFTLTHPANATTLFGASSVTQLEANLGSLEVLERVGAEAIRAAVEPFWADRDVVNPEGP
ncbi:aldo/keto reductase [Leucobacter sp. cx-42]|uniref:aldo/keto reductase n=1 Tax=unclassified Leucobacter TaxID=2621730 RepID=UPI00165D772C|nr:MULTISPECIES: aldo/keto reductase [unclassified Leucobacter]MBC9953395.1 aldo/keto reductase [Leucobacter sp. cx-42]